MGLFAYRAFGLTISSEIECHELLPGTGTADIRVWYGSVPFHLDNPVAQGVLYQAAPQQFLLNLAGVARYLVRNGNEIIVDPAVESDGDSIRLFLFGSAFGALLFQRGVLPLHGSAVATPRGSVLFVGPSGHGKSTLAGAFHLRGYPVLSDDVSAITSINGVPQILPAYPRLLLWADSVDRLGMESTKLTPARASLEKYHFPVVQGFASEATPLYAVYVLETTNSREVSLTPLTGFAKIKTLTDNTYRGHFLKGMKLADQHFRQIGAVAEHARVVRVERPDGAFRLDELVDLLEKDFVS